MFVGNKAIKALKCAMQHSSPLERVWRKEPSAFIHLFLPQMAIDYTMEINQQLYEDDVANKFRDIGYLHNMCLHNLNVDVTAHASS